MSRHEKPMISEAYQILRKLMFSKSMTETTRRAIRVRLEVILEQEEKSFDKWNEMIRHKMNTTRQRTIEREFKKRIQAIKIVIHMLTPYWERASDVPTFVVRKDRKNET